ncbi:MAG: TldD/PmbA family protein [Nitrososphaerota archaeon]
MLEWVLRHAERLGADETEVYYSYSREMKVEINLGQVSSCRFSDEQGVGLRVVVNGAVGFSFSNNLDRTRLEYVVDKAVRAARVSKPDEKWRGLPSPKKPSAVLGIFDNRVCSVTEEELVDTAVAMLNAATNYSDKVSAYWGVVVSGREKVSIMNSCGIDVSAEGTEMGCALGTVAKDGERVSPECSDFDFQRSHKIDPERVGREAARLAVESLKTADVEQGWKPAVLAHPALSSLISYTFLQAISGDNVVRERTPYAGKIGEQVASSILNIVDDGTLEGGLNSFPFDDEGVPTQRKSIIDKGVLKGFLFDTYWGNVAGVESTGNAGRAGYASLPQIAATNLVVTKGDVSPEKLIEEIDDGVIIWDVQGAHSSNPVSGEISVVANPCWVIKGGEIIGSARTAMVADNFYEMLKRVDGVANDVRKYAYLVSPSVRFSSVRLVAASL